MDKTYSEQSLTSPQISIALIGNWPLFLNNDLLYSNHCTTSPHPNVGSLSQAGNRFHVHCRLH